MHSILVLPKEFGAYLAHRHVDGALDLGHRDGKLLDGAQQPARYGLGVQLLAAIASALVDGARERLPKELPALNAEETKSIIERGVQAGANGETVYIAKPVLFCAIKLVSIPDALVKANDSWWQMVAPGTCQ